MINTRNVQLDARFHLPFSDLRSDQYSLCCCEIEPKICPKWAGFHHNSTTIGPIANRRIGDERTRQTAYLTYRLCRDTMRTAILNWRKKCWPLRSGFCAETWCNSPVPGWNRTRNRTGNLDPLLTLIITQYLDYLALDNESDVLVVPMRVYNLVHGLPWFHKRNLDVS